MSTSVASFCFLVCLIPTVALGQSRSPSTHKGASSRGAKSAVSKPRDSANRIRICQGVALPSGYTIVAYETASACPHGAYLLQKDDTQSSVPDVAASNPSQSISLNETAAAAASRPRRITTEQVKTAVPELAAVSNTVNASREPALSGSSLRAPGEVESGTALSLDDKKDEEVGEGDIVRIDTNLVTVPVSVLDRNGRFVGDLKRDSFTVFENGVEQRIANFEPTEKPFTVALLLDTSGSTYFHLSEIKDAAITFAKQLRPHDRVLVVTFDERVMLLTEATNDLNVVTEVIQAYAYTGHSTRLYDALDLVINQRLNNIQGRKAIVLFTDGVDTASYSATFKSTLRQAEELDALVYPIQYDTSDFIAATQGSVSVVTTRRTQWPFPSRSSSRTVYSPRVSLPGPGQTIGEYRLADDYLHQLADKTGARLYKANDNTQLADAFAKIAEELRCQYSLSYYPSTSAQGGERRQIRVRVNRPDLAVRAKDGYVQRGGSTPQ